MAAPTDQSDPYGAIAELYDLEHAGHSEDIDLYLQFAEVIGDPILELGCGTGRVVAPLAEAGRRVTGIDVSDAMLQRARLNLSTVSYRERVSLAKLAMTSADDAPGGPFGMVLFSLNALLHLDSVAEQRLALQAAKRALDPRGMLVIDVLSPSPELLVSLDGGVHHEGHWSRADGSTVDRFSARTLDHARQQIDTELWYDCVGAAGALTRVRTRFPMRYVTRSELEHLLELTGFVEWNVYGSYELDPYDSLSDRLLITAEVTPS